MKSRKWLALAASVSLVALLSTGLSMAAVQEEEETLALIMEQVTAANNKINRYVRTPVADKVAVDGTAVTKPQATPRSGLPRSTRIAPPPTRKSLSLVPSALVS